MAVVAELAILRTQAGAMYQLLCEYFKIFASGCS